MTVQQQNTLLRSALLEAAAVDFREALEHPEETEKTPRQIKRFRAMLADPFIYAKRARRPLWKQILHSAAMLTVAIGLSITILAVVSPTVRAAIKQWFMEIRQSDIVYYFTGEPKGEALSYYTITKLPEGYVQTEEIIEFPGYRSITYVNDANQPIYFSYVLMNQGAALGIGTENMIIKDIRVNGCGGQLYISSDSAVSNAISWIDEERNIQFLIDAYTDELALLNMAESIFLVK